MTWDAPYYANALREIADRLEATDDARTLKRVVDELDTVAGTLRFDVAALREPPMTKTKKGATT